MASPRSGGGWPAILYTFRKARQAGGIRRLWRAMRSRNACKTCAVGMGGQKGGMVNEAGSFPELCKKSLQAMVADLQGAVPTDFWIRNPIGKMRALTPRQLESSGRLAHPVRYTRATGRYEPISWSDALDSVATRLGLTPPDETFWYFSGRSSNEAGFLLQLFARLYGTNNVNNCSYFCHQASGVGLASTIGSGTATVILDDLEHADLVFLIGANPASNHPRLMETLRRVRSRGGDIIVLNPIREAALEDFHVPSNLASLLFGSKIASSFVQPHIGGDLALLTAIARRVVELGAHDPSFLESNTDGWPELAASLSASDPDDLARKAGVPAAEVDALAGRYARAERVVFAWAMGITHHAHGVDTVRAIANLALLRGMVGKPGAGLMPIRGHSNVQGIGSVGVAPRLSKAIFDGLTERYGLSLPTTPGLDTLACIEAAAEGRVKVGICLGGNLYGSNPDADYASRALQNLDLAVYLSTTLNTGHAWGAARETIILPVAARDEEPQPTTQESMFNYVRMSDGGPARLDGPRSEVEVISDLAHRVLGPNTPVDFQKMRETRSIRAMIAAVVPGYEAIGRIDETRTEFQIDGRTLHTPVFATPSGRARIHSPVIPDLPVASDEFRLMTIRSEGQFNTVVYEEEDLYRGTDARDVILLHPSDITARGLRPDDRVTVHGPAGSLPSIGIVAFERIRPGNAAMYFPEANRLLSRTSDPLSRTPAFKGAAIRIAYQHDSIQLSA